jgi:heat-inducible transcriptional repressor
MIDGMLGILERMFSDKEGENTERVYLGGTLNMLNQPEFKDINKLKNLFSIFEENRKLRELLHTGCDQQGLNVTIGSENPDLAFKDCSIISATYHINGRQNRFDWGFWARPGWIMARRLRLWII